MKRVLKSSVARIPGDFQESIRIFARDNLEKNISMFCNNVKDAVNAMRDIFIQTTKIPGSTKLVTYHLSVGDKKGNSAIFEYMKEELHAFTNVRVFKEYPHKIHYYNLDQTRVMTNDPQFNVQIGSLVY